MAITLADFTKIWASTSPLTPYSFSESNYKEGWNFIGGTPPSRQMWDSIQNQNDEKLKYIVDNFLPLSGGTMTGAIESTGEAIKNIDDTSHVRILGGTDSTSSYIGIWAKDNSATPGVIQLRTSDGTNNKSLLAYPNGDLTWNGKNLDYCADLSIFADYENFTAPTVFSNRIKVVPSGDFGGYKQVGKVVYVHYTFQMNMNMNKGAWTIAQGFPRPYIDGGAWSVVPITVSAWYGDNESGYFTSASIDAYGSLYLILSGNVTAGTSGDTNHGIVVHGVYLAK